MSHIAEQKIRHSLLKLETEQNALKLSEMHFVLAVSGGADSVFLLEVMHRLSTEYNFSISVGTVDHRMRPEIESAGDASFVLSLCNELTPPVPCTIIRLKEGEVFTCAEQRGKGIEDAARFLRYRSLQKLLDSAPKGAFLCTAHTASDQLETLLMRFVQGAQGRSKMGILRRRGSLFRPMLDIERSQIEDWLRVQGIHWREDASNASDVYFRNRIRNHLVPLLDAEFTGWRSGITRGAFFAGLDEDFIEQDFPLDWEKKENSLMCSSEHFFALAPALRLRLLKNGLRKLAITHRVPSGFLYRIAILKPKVKNNVVKISGSQIVFRIDGANAYLERDIVKNNKSGYLIYIRSPGTFTLPFGNLNVVGEKSSVRIGQLDGVFRLPLIIRSRLSGDTVVTSEGKRKTIKKLMNDWSVSGDLRSALPVIEEGGVVRAVYGSIFGYPDWYVHP